MQTKMMKELVEIAKSIEMVKVMNDQQARMLDYVNKELEAINRSLAESPENGGATSSIPEDKTHYQMIVDFFVQNKNTPSSMNAIAKATGIQIAALGQVMYRTHAANFKRAKPVIGTGRLQWSMKDEVYHNLDGSEKKDMVGKTAKDCCVLILRENDNRPMNALTLAREALRRGYSGGAEGSEDDILMTTAKSFWARLGRDQRFAEVRPQVFMLTNHGKTYEFPQQKLFDE